jgi:hypothetical protein
MQNYDRLLQLGLLYMVNEIKDPLTNIILSLELMEKDIDNPGAFLPILKRNSLLINEHITTICTFLKNEQIGLTDLCLHDGIHDHAFHLPADEEKPGTPPVE